ncbi:hypothetical protein BGZ51_007195, partial [Haplosporangium sp. Z 767]
MDITEPLSLKDDIADRLNTISVDGSKKGAFWEASIRIFRRAAFNKVYQTPTTRPHRPPMALTQPPFTSSFWKGFWKEPIPHNARNVWRRLLINKLPSGTRLHAIIPEMIEPLCRKCSNGLETDRHLLFSCFKKLEVWQGALRKYIEDRAWTAAYIE